MDLTSPLQLSVQESGLDFFAELKRLSELFLHLAPENGIITLADISLLKNTRPTLSLPDKIKNYLTPEEQTHLATFRFEKRYKEWLAGRLAAKHAIISLYRQSDLTPQKADTFSILPDENGKPYLHPTPETSIDISISHSHQYAAAVSSIEKNIGIDIQKMEPKINKLTERFTTPQEKSQFRDIGNATHINTNIWAIKEAVKKSLLHDQPSIFSGITIESTKQKSTSRWSVLCSTLQQQGNTLAKVEIDSFNDYIIAVAVGENNA